MRNILISFYVGLPLSGSLQNITAQTTTWTEVAPGVWKTVVGIPDKLDLFDAAGIKPVVETLSKMGIAKFPVSESDIVAEVVKGETYLRFPLVKEEQIFGFGLNFKTVHQRGKILQLHVDHYGGTDNGRTHAPVPFYVSDRGYGVFINSSRYLTVYAGTAVRKDSPEVPEVRGSKTSEEWLRRMQTVCFSPMAMINAWSSETKPWSFPDVAKEVKEYALLRMQLIPYLYSEFARYHFEGTPPFRGMNLEEGFDARAKMELKNENLNDNPYAEAVLKEIKDQYMTGEYLLVAPLFTGQTSRKVVLSKGKWYDFYTGKYAGGGEVINVTPGLDKIPVYVKDGGIIPMMLPALHAPAAGQKFDLEIRYYGSKPGNYRLYDDDGETFDYEKGMYSWREIKVIQDKKGKLSGTISKAEKGKPDNLGTVSWKFMSGE